MLTSLFHMGGYGLYVWTAYGITLLVLFAHLFISNHRLRKLWRQLVAQYENAS